MKHVLTHALVLLFFFTCFSPALLHAQPLPSQLNLTAQSPDSFLVSFKTTKGKFVMKAHRNWSPLAADRLYVLATNGYFNDNVIYRVAPTKSFEGGFVVQFGIVNNVEANKAWEQAPLKDEPVMHPHSRGAVSFARGAPNTRSNELAITLTPCLELDTVNYQGVIGFPTVAEVVEGMDVIEMFNRKYGNSVFEHKDSLYIGRKYFDRVYSGLDRIISVRVIKTW